MVIDELPVDFENADAERGAGSAIRVVLADDHELIRRSMRSVLDGEVGIDVVGGSGGGRRDGL